MSLSMAQQARAARAHVAQELNRTADGARLLQDQDFADRLDANFITIFAIFAELYGGRNDCLEQFTELIRLTGQSWRDRPADLKALDKERERDREWYLSNRMLGGVCYVDRYAGTLDGVRAKIPYFKELGLTYLHLMPLFLTPEPLSDGGYAISSYRQVKPALGDMNQLRQLAADLHRAGISLVVRDPPSLLASTALTRSAAGPGLQPHVERARVGQEGGGRRPGVRAVLLDLPEPRCAGGV
jgi:amylosucrase